MNISELIEALQTLKEAYGDIPLAITQRVGAEKHGQRIVIRPV